MSAEGSTAKMRIGAELNALCRLSAAIGNDPHLIQGAGGNVSYTAGDTMWIKASGTWLADAERRNIMVPVTLPAGADGAFAVADFDTTGLRPSIETSMHAALPHAVVLHVHSVDTIALAVRMDGEVALVERLRGLRWAFIPYRRPGTPLTEAIVDATRDRPADVLILANHGLVVAADDVDAAAALLSDVVARLATTPRTAPDGGARPFATSGYRLPDDPAVHAIATDRTSLGIATGGVLYPDHVVFLGESPVVIDRAEQLAEALRQRALADQPRAKWVIVRGCGVLVADDIARGGNEMLRCLADVAARIPADAELRFLSPDEIAALIDWDAEKYRQRLAKLAA